MKGRHVIFVLITFIFFNLPNLLNDYNKKKIIMKR